MTFPQRERSGALSRGTTMTLPLTGATSPPTSPDGTLGKRLGRDFPERARPPHRTRLAGRPGCPLLVSVIAFAMPSLKVCSNSSTDRLFPPLWQSGYPYRAHETNCWLLPRRRQFPPGKWQATIYALPSDGYLLRLEDFKVTNGPDLHVLLSAHPDPRSRSEVKDEGYPMTGLASPEGT